MVRPVNASQALLKNVHSLSGPETQIMTGAASARFPKRCSISGRAGPVRAG
jgi:hypothetical protein